jgi:predicted DNA-binding transcriptional regulator YafY
VRASRLVSLLLLLQTRGRMTADELAGVLEVSTRTIYRDLDALAEAGVPVYAERGPGGGAQLVEGYRTRLTGLNADEAEALFFSGLPGPAAELGIGTVLAAAQLKVLAALPPELRSRATRVRERFHLVTPGWFDSSEQLANLPTIADAVWRERRMHIRYRRGETVVHRLVDPLGLVLKSSTWYLVARREGALRTYRVSRIVQVEPTDDRFDRPEEFDLASYWESSTTAFEEQVRFDVTLRVASDGMRALANAIGSRRVEQALAAARPAGRDGWQTLTVRMESIDWAHDDLLRAGPGVEVLRPRELRRRLAVTAHALAERYADSLELLPAADAEVHEQAPAPIDAPDRMPVGARS